MPEHTLDFSKQVINDLTSLGKALGYYVETELTIEKNENNPPAVDVAWLSETGQIFPLMIFEVESRPTNSIANNVVKVFGQPNQSFEKPLFYFHIIVKGGEDTSRITNLERLFGTYNYRIYKLQESQTTQLIKDILSQHRRLGQRIDLLALVSTMEQSSWVSLDLDSIILHVEQIGFERGMGTYLPRYAKLASSQPKFVNHFVRYLQARYSVPSIAREVDEYQAYLGDFWSIPIHLGILIATSPNQAKKRYFDLLREWQEKSYYYTQIGPHLGLDADYDRFIMGLAASLWALMAVLVNSIPQAVVYIATQCREILIGLNSAPSKSSFFTALWMLHIASSMNETHEEFEFARSFINDRGGVSEHLMLEPPSAVSEDTEWPNTDARIQVPDLEAFKKLLSPHYISHDQRRSETIHLAIECLIDNNMWLNWSPKLVRLLHM